MKKALVKHERAFGPSDIIKQSSENKAFSNDVECAYRPDIVVSDMRTRKKLMDQEVMEGELGSGFVALSGGYGTFEELMEGHNLKSIEHP